MYGLQPCVCGRIGSATVSGGADSVVVVATAARFPPCSVVRNMPPRERSSSSILRCQYHNHRSSPSRTTKCNAGRGTALGRLTSTRTHTLISTIVAAHATGAQDRSSAVGLSGSNFAGRNLHTTAASVSQLVARRKRRKRVQVEATVASQRYDYSQTSK